MSKVNYHHGYGAAGAAPQGTAATTAAPATTTALSAGSADGVGDDDGAGPAISADDDDEVAARSGSDGATASLSRTLAEKLSAGLITADEHDHIIKVSIEATEALEADDAEAEAKAEARAEATGGNESRSDGGGGGGSNSGNVEAAYAYPLSPEPASTSPKLVRQAGQSPMPIGRSDQRAVQAAVRAMTRAGIPQDTCETRIADLVGFGFDPVKAALCLRHTDGDIAEAMALLLDSPDGGI